MAVDDLWYRTKRGPGGERIPSARHGRGKRWRVRYIDDEGVPRQPLFEKKADAERHDALVRADVSRGVYVDPAAGRVTVADYFEQWRKLQLHVETTQIKTEWVGRLHLAPTTLGRMQIGVARRSHIQGWVQDRSRVLQPSSLHPAYAYVAGMFKAAVLDRVIAVSPCQKITLPDLVVAKRRIITSEQVHDLADALGVPGSPRPAALHYRPHPYLAAGCGLRQGEVFGLELEHLAFGERRIHIAQQLKSVPGRQPFLCAPKTATSVRTVDMSDVVHDELTAHIERYPVREVEIDDETDPRRPRRRRAQLVFLNALGRPIHRGSYSDPWVGAVRRAGLPKGYEFHALRHYYATLLIHAGASVVTVQLALGHANPTITLNRYVGEWPEATELPGVIVDRALKRSGPRR